MRIGMGIFSQVPSVTYLDFAQYLGVDSEDVSKIFSYRAVGALIGIGIGSIYMQFKPFSSHLDTMTVYGISGVLAGLTTMLVPLMKNLILLNFMIWVSAIFYGVIDLGMQAAVIEAWGPQGSKPLVQAYHAFWSVGSILSPYIAEPFSSVNAESDACPGNHHNSTVNNTVELVDLGFDQPNYGIPDIFWPWALSGVIYCLAGIGSIWLGLKFLREKIQLRYTAVKTDIDLDLDQKTDQIEYKSDFWRYDIWICAIAFMMWFTIRGVG